MTIRFLSHFPLVVVISFLLACSGGTGDETAYFERNAGQDEPIGESPDDSATALEDEATGDDDEAIAGAGDEGPGESADEDPTPELDELDGVLEDESPPSLDGLEVGGTCRPVCELGDATDADGEGVLDGWGWENDESCLVEGSAPAAQATPCSLGRAPVELGPPALPGEAANRPEGNDSSGFFVSGGRLFDALGNDFVMRGVNNPLAWFRNRNTGALAWTAQIAATGANTVRLVWETDVDDVSLLREAVQRTIDYSMVPMIELHDVTGGRDVDQPAQMARYYAETPAVRELLLDYEGYLLVNIANEWDGADGIYVEAYTRAIEVMRGAGLNHTLVIDANGYGQNAGTVIREGQGLLDVDPQHNLLFSTHVYQSFRDPGTVIDTLERAVEAQIPFIVGEFGFQHGSDREGNPIPVAFETLLAEADRLALGYLAWSWTGNSSDVAYLDLTARSGSVAELSDWGNDVVNGPAGIRATSELASMFE